VDAAVHADAARIAPGDRWFVDKTYVRLNGMSRYVCRVVDQYGPVINVLLSARRDAAGPGGSSPERPAP
jgi:IS6 family transposase